METILMKRQPKANLIMYNRHVRYSSSAHLCCIKMSHFHDKIWID